MQIKPNIKKIRKRLDKINELIIIGLKNRSKYPLNSKSELLLENNNANEKSIGKEITKEYKKIIKKICKRKENPATYLQTAKIDSKNIELLKERIIHLGKQVAEYKLFEDPSLANLSGKKEILQKLTISKREKEVIQNTLKLTKKYKIKNANAIKKFVKNIIKLTKKVQMQKVLEKKILIR